MTRKHWIIFFGFFLLLASFILAINKQEKKQLNWQFFIENKIATKSILNAGKNLSFDQKDIYFGDGKNSIYSLNQNSGEINWVSKIGADTPFQIKVDEKFLYIASFDSHIYCLDKKNGLTTWSFAIPNQFLPDTEIIFDENDHYLFFADRGGFIYALDKKNGQQVWKNNLGTIDNTKDFKDGSIHFGFLKQNNQEIIVDHFPNSKIYKINKNNGLVVEERTSTKTIELSKQQNSFNINKFNIKINKNIIAQPQINCFDQNNQLQWSYQTEHKVNHNEFYQFGQRLFYLNADNNLLTSILINENKPQTQKINFFILENFQEHDFYKNKSNHQITFVETKISKFKIILNNWFNKITYLFKNFSQIKKVDINLELLPNQAEFTIFHQQNFYRNVFTDVKIEAEFSRNNQSETIKVKGFYYDHNLWKVRAKLSHGQWNWQIKVKTPLWTNKQSGNIEIKKDQTKNLTIENGGLIDENGQLFVPIGLQDAIMDRNMDGNPLNQMGHAKTTIPPINSENSSYLNFPDYLDLYKNEADINLFRYGPDNWAPSIWQNLDKPKDFAMNINGNLQGDIIISEAKQRDIKVMMSIFAFFPPYTSKEAIAKKNNQKVITQYLDYIIARYASNIDIWELANEALPSQEWQSFVSDYLSKNDPYHHPITISLENPQLKNSDLLSIHLYTHPKNNLELVEEIDKILQKTKEQNWSGAIMLSELGFSDANYFTGSADLMRKISWILAMQKIGVVWWNVGDIFWQNGNTSNIYLGPNERTYLKELKQKLQFYGENSKIKQEISSQKNLAIYQLKNEQAEIFYLVRLKHEQQIDKKFSIKTDKPSTVRIINPQKNTVVQKLKINQQTSEILLPDFEDDLAILLFKE